ncbi:MAG: ADP-ribosyltransferase, partial [Blastopirellula sp. JB062]
MTRNGELAAVKFQRLRQSGSREVATPASLWVTYGREYGNWFGRSINQNSYSPWYEKWMESGAKDVMRRRMIKDSYRSGVYMVPDEIVTMPDGTKLHWMDIARRGDEVALSGASVVLPQKYDANGNPMMKYEPPKDFGTPTGILEWNDRIDWDIWKGQGVFREVFEAASSGSGFSGRSIPLMMFLGSVSEEFKEVLHCVNRDILRPACHINFGCQPDYEVIAKPLTEVFAEDMSGNQMGGGAMGGPASSQQSGGWNQQQGPRGGQQWVNSSTGAVSYKQPAQFSEGARSYSCLMGLFESNVTEHVRQLGRNISTADLALDGIEKNPHVTLLWGIHSDESEQIRFVLKRYGPCGLRLGGLGCFEGDDQDVLYVSVESNAIHEIRAVLESSIPNTQTHDCYIPHVTLAYLRPGMGKKYVENPQLLGHADEQDSLAWVSTLEFSNSREEREYIRLTGEMLQFSEDDSKKNDEFERQHPRNEDGKFVKKDEPESRRSKSQISRLAELFPRSSAIRQVHDDVDFDLLDRSIEHVNKDQKELFKKYANSGFYRKINAALRGDTKMTTELQEAFDLMQSAILNAPPLPDMVIYRGIGVRDSDEAAKAFEKLEESGEDHVSEGFSSTSLSPMVAAERGEEFGQSVVFEIVPRRGLFISSFSESDAGPFVIEPELEILLPHKAKFRIID